MKTSILTGLLAFVLIVLLVSGAVALEALLCYAVYNYLIVPAFSLKVIPYLGFLGIVILLNIVSGIFKRIVVKVKK